MKRIIIISILFIRLIASNEEKSNLHSWTQIEKPSIENNFQEKKIYQTNHMDEAISVILFESLFHIEKKKLNSDFKYLKEFENNIKNK
jgi:helix-turn-helix protein